MHIEDCAQCGGHGQVNVMDIEDKVKIMMEENPEQNLILSPGEIRDLSVILEMGKGETHGTDVTVAGPTATEEAP
jgi:hypothetical protein